MCLNFASAKNPGGGFLNGSRAQEESLALSSTLHVSQMEVFEFYEKHREMKSCVYSDDMIFSPNVTFFRNNNGELIEPVNCDIITSPAVNAGAVKRNEPEISHQITELMSIRADKMLALSAANKCKRLILGAWGCGVFDNDPKVIAEIFFELLNNKYKDVFEHVCFAIYSRDPKFIEPFQKLFE